MTTAHICVHALLPKKGTAYWQVTKKHPTEYLEFLTPWTMRQGEYPLQNQSPDTSNASVCIQSGAKDEGKCLLPLKTMPPFLQRSCAMLKSTSAVTSSAEVGDVWLYVGGEEH